MIDTLPKASVAYAERFERIGVTADAPTASRTRDEFARWLRRSFDLDSTRVSDVVLAIYEALANSAEFAYQASTRPGTMDVRASYHPVEYALKVTVVDRGLWRTSPPTHGDRHRGRGIALMKALSDRSSIQTSTAGTVVYLGWTDLSPR